MLSEVEIICTAILLSGSLTFILLERFYPYTKGLKLFREGFWLDFVWYTLVQSFFLTILVFSLIIAPLEHWFGVAEQGYISHWPIWVIVLFFLVTHDFYIYWFHRLQHYSKLMWRTHEAHHSVKEVDWLAGARSHSIEIIINQTIEFLPIIFLLDTETAAIVVPIKALIDALWGQFVHANINLKLGKLSYFINGPELHQWHHANSVDVYHANFSTKFSIWDWLFGTAYLPGTEKPKKFGLWYRYPRDYFAQHIFALKRFDVGKLESKPLVSEYLNLRHKLLSKMRLRKKNNPIKAKPV